jgi:hypothetical protein
MLADLDEVLAVDLLDNVDREAVRELIRLRPRCKTTADRLATGGPDHELVYFDWQQHWSRTKPLFERTDVRYAACQHICGRNCCKYCSEYWFVGELKLGCWPPLDTDGCEGKVFPLLLSHDGQEVGGDGSEKAPLGLSIMPDSDAQQLVREQNEELTQLLDNFGQGADEDDEFDMKYEVVRKYQDKCIAWLATELDDARLLYSGGGWHEDLMPLTVRLAQLLAPPGAILELRVQPPDEADRDSRSVERAWESAVVVDVTNKVVYTLSTSYFKLLCEPAPKVVEGKEIVRRWLKDGGIPPVVYVWLRRRLPVELVREVQALLLGRDAMPIARWLQYADATPNNWLPPRSMSYFRTARGWTGCWSYRDCLRECHPADSHCTECDALHTINAELESRVGELEPAAAAPVYDDGIVTPRRTRQLEAAYDLLRAREHEVAEDLRPVIERAIGAIFANLALARSEDSALARFASTSQTHD